MAAQPSPSSAIHLSKLSSKTAIHDVGTVLTSVSQFSLLRKGLLFISTPLYLATHTDQEILREGLKTRTIISTLHPRNPRYIQGPALGSYAIEQYVTEDFLGLRACHIHLRHGTDFIRDAISKLPLWSKLKFQYDAETANDSITPDLVQKVQDLVWNRDSIDESFAILTTSASLIGRLFNDILSRAKSYPLIISGDFMLRDNGLLVFLLLLLLEAPFSAIENAYMRVAEDFSLRSKEAGITETPVTQARARNRKHWARELLRRLTARYGSMSAYFDSAGVNEVNRDKIKDILLFSEEKTLVDIT